MKSLLLLGLALILTLVALAQAACPEYDGLVDSAKTYFKNGDYRKALYKYNSAKTCSPTKRAQVDSMINILFEKIELERKNARAAENRIRKIFNDMQEARSKVNELVQEKNMADSVRWVERFTNNNALWIERIPREDGTVDTFTSRNASWFRNLSREDQDSLRGWVAVLGRIGRAAEIDSIATFFRLLDDAKVYDTAYSNYSGRNETAVKWTKLPAKRTEAINYYGLRVVDGLFFLGWEKIGQASDLLPAYHAERFRSMFTRISRVLENHRRDATQDYWMPDTLIGLPSNDLFAKRCPDNANFIWGYLNHNDYKKLQMRFLNLSLADFSLTTDSSLDLTDSGKFNSILSASANYGYQVARGIDYVMKKNWIDSKTMTYAFPDMGKLMDGKGNLLTEFKRGSSGYYFFSPDGRYLVTWENNHLLLYDTKERKFISLPNAADALTMSMASDSKTIAYYNRATKTIYVSDFEGHIRDQIPSGGSGIVNIDNIDFTGGEAFLKINNKDSICLMDIRSRKVIMSFSKSFVDEIVVSPNKKDILATCNTEYQTAGKTHEGKLAILIDADLNIKAKLYSGCSNFFFTPGGDYVVGYGETSLMRWPIGKPAPTGTFRTCLTFNELVNYSCMLYARFATIDDADQIETGARKLKDLAADETDIRLKLLYYRQSRNLFDRLAYGNAKNISKGRIPFFYDWYNWIDNRLGNKNFRDQFIREQAAVKIFDEMVNSPDSVYPQQLFYAANGNMLLANLYDSLGAYNTSFVGQLNKEISLRQRVFEKDPDNDNNVYYYTGAIKRLSRVCDSVGWMGLRNREHAARLAMFRDEESLLAEKMRILPDSFGVKPYYIDAVTQLAASFLYTYVSRSGDYARALDSAAYFADKGLALSPDKMDSAWLMIVKARAYLFQPDGLENSLALYRQVKNRFPEVTRENKLNQLRYLQEAGASDTGNMRKVEEFLKQE